MIENRVRPHIGGVLSVVGGALARVGVRPNQLTLAGLAVTVVGSALVGAGRFVTGGLVVLAGSAIDALDGSVARARGRAGLQGAFLDSVADRVSETAMFAGLAVAVAGDGVLVGLAVASLGASLITSYLRARAEGIGAGGSGGLMGRAERVLLYSAGLVAGMPEVMLWAMAVLTWVTVVQRFRAAWGQLSS